MNLNIENIQVAHIGEVQGRNVGAIILNKIQINVSALITHYKIYLQIHIYME